MQHAGSIFLEGKGSWGIVRNVIFKMDQGSVIKKKLGRDN